MSSKEEADQLQFLGEFKDSRTAQKSQLQSEPDKSQYTPSPQKEVQKVSEDLDTKLKKLSFSDSSTDNSWKQVGLSLAGHKDQARSAIIHNNKLIVRAAEPLCKRYSQIVEAFMENEAGWRSFVQQVALLPELMFLVRSCERRLHGIVTGLDKIDKLCKKKRLSKHEASLSEIDCSIQLGLEKYQIKQDKNLIAAHNKRRRKQESSNLKRRREKSIQDTKRAPSFILESGNESFNADSSAKQIMSRLESKSDPWEPDILEAESAEKNDYELPPPGDAFQAWLEKGGWGEYFVTFFRAGWGQVQLLECKNADDLLRVGIPEKDAKLISDWLNFQRDDKEPALLNEVSNDQPPAALSVLPKENRIEKPVPPKRLVSPKRLASPFGRLKLNQQKKSEKYTFPAAVYQPSTSLSKFEQPKEVVPSVSSQSKSKLQTHNNIVETKESHVSANIAHNKKGLSSRYARSRTPRGPSKMRAHDL